MHMTYTYHNINFAHMHYIYSYVIILTQREPPFSFVVLAMGRPLLRDVIIEISGVDWYLFGVQLRLPPCVLEDIGRDKDGSVARRSAVVNTWLRTDTSASWEGLITALGRMGGEDVLVQRLKEKYLSPPKATCSAIGSNHPGIVKFTNEMSAKFSSLVHDVFLNFKRRNVDHDEIVIYASTFRVASSEIPYQLLPKEYIDQLSKATSVMNVFAVLGGYWDFQNYHLLDFLVQKLGNDAVNRLVREYKEEFLVYQRNVKLLEFVAILPECGVGQEKIDSDKMVVKLPRSWPEASLECVEEFHLKVSQAFGIPLHVIRFDSGGEGSIVITWLIPSSLSPVIHTSPQALLELQILEMHCLPLAQGSRRSVKASKGKVLPLAGPSESTEATPTPSVWKKIKTFFKRKRVDSPQQQSSPPPSPRLHSQVSPPDSPVHRSLLQRPLPGSPPLYRSLTASLLSYSDVSRCETPSNDSAPPLSSSPLHVPRSTTLPFYLRSPQQRRSHASRSASEPQLNRSLHSSKESLDEINIQGLFRSTSEGSSIVDLPMGPYGYLRGREGSGISTGTGSAASFCSRSSFQG